MLLRLQVDHIDQVLEVMMAKFNAGPLNALKGKTPIEAFTMWARDDNAVVRCVPEAFREHVSLADLQVKVRIASDVGSGKQPVIRFQHADYIGPKLATFRSRGREECILVLNENTANVAFLYSSDGTELDRLQARGIWRAPHSLSQRVNFVKLRGKGKIRWPGEDESPVEILRDYLAKGAATNKRDALNFARVIKEVKVKKTKSAQLPSSNGSAPDAKPATANAADGPKPQRPAVVNTMKSGGNW